MHGRAVLVIGDVLCKKQPFYLHFAERDFRLEHFEMALRPLQILGIDPMSL